MATTEFIAAIELGSSKAAGIAGKKNPDGSIQILAYAREDAAPFIHKGCIYNIDKAAHALTAIKADMEAQLGHSIAKVYVGISGQSLRTIENAVIRPLPQESIISMEMIDAINDENRNTPFIDMCMLDVAPQEYKIDNALYADPVGVTGQHITARFLNIVARASVRKNLELSFEQAGIKIADIFVTPLALAKVVLTESEMRSGCALVDFGAGTTTLQIYKNNLLRYLCVLPLGGNNISHDITSLKMEDEEAEQLKLKYGNALPIEEEQENKVHSCTTPGGLTVEFDTLNDIVGARAEEIVANVWNQIRLSGYEYKLFAGIVFTGGGSNLKNLDSLFRKVSKIEKLRTASFVYTDIQGPKEMLYKDGTQNSLLGLLAMGDENCCAEEEAPQPTPQQGTQIPLSFDDQEPEQQTATNNPVPPADPPKKDKNSHKKGHEKAETDNKADKKQETSWWKKSLVKFTGELFSDSDAMTDEPSKK